MKLARVAALALVLGAMGVVGPAQKDATASVAIAATFDGLVGGSDAVVVATSMESNAQYEDGRIWTYTRLHVENAIAGDAATNGEVVVRAFGGVINHVGMLSEGEPSFVVGKTQLLFLHHTPKGAGGAGAYFVTANAQGQFSLVEDPATHVTHFRRSASLGAIVSPKDGAQVAPGTYQTPRVMATRTLATDLIENRAVVDVARDIASAYRRLHASP